MRRIYSLLAAMILMAMGNAQAQTVLYERGGEDTAWSNADLAEWPGSGGTIVISNGLNYTSPENGGGIYTKSITTKDNSKVTVNAKWYVGASTGRAGNHNFIKLGNIEIRAYGQDQKGGIYPTGENTIGDAYVSFGNKADVRPGEADAPWDITLTMDKASGKLTYTIILPSSGTKQGLISLSSASFDDIAIGFRRGGRTGTSNSTLVSISITEEAQEVKTASYKVKFVDNEGNSIKDEETRSGVVGNSIALNASDVANFGVEGAYYLFISDDAEEKTIAEDGSTVVTIVFRSAETWSYIVNEVCGENIVRTTEGSGFETLRMSVPFHRYNVIDHTLYLVDIPNVKEYNHFFALNENGQVENVNYNATETTDVVFYSEGEDIKGLTACTSANTGVRSSNSSSAYAANGKVKVTTLSAGTYKITAGIYDGTSAHDSKWTFLAGDEQIAEFTCTQINFQELTSDEFTLEKETAIYIEQGGNKDKGIDFVLITGNGGTVDVESIEVTIGAAKYATLYYGDTSLEVPAGVTATTYTIAEDNVTLVESKVYTVGNVIPAGEAVVLQGAANTYSFDIVATEATPDTNNLLIGTDELTTFEEDGYKFYMLSNGIYGIGFYLQNESGNSIANDEHKAFLRVAEATASKAFFSLGGEATAINSVATAKKETKGVFDLQGRRVDNPVKGLYIMNGKKVVIK